MSKVKGHQVPENSGVVACRNMCCQIEGEVLEDRLTSGQRGHCSAGSDGRRQPPGYRRTMRTTQGCAEVPRSPVR